MVADKEKAEKALKNLQESTQKTIKALERKATDAGNTVMAKIGALEESEKKGDDALMWGKKMEAERDAAKLDLIKFMSTSELQIQLAVAKAKLTASHLMLSSTASQANNAGSPSTPASLATPADLFASFFAEPDKALVAPPL